MVDLDNKANEKSDFMSEFDNENIIGELNIILNYILNPVCDNLTILEKIRWVYIKLGKLFCYDFRVLENKSDIVKKNIEYDKDVVNKFQTCLQISQIMNIVLNNIDPKKCKSRIIERELPGRHDSIKHVANEITLSTGEKYILDLTLDLYLIQSGCQTKEFGYTTDMQGTQDIISLSECKKMDKKLGLYPITGYTNEKFDKIKQRLLDNYSQGLSFKEIIKKCFEIISNKMSINFEGPHEGKSYVSMLVQEMLKNYNYYDLGFNEYNLYYKENKQYNFVTIFKFTLHDEIVWYMYSNKIGLIEINEKLISSMINSGWSTNSNSLKDKFGQKKK